MFFFFNDTATTEIYTLSLHDALPISLPEHGHEAACRRWAGCGARDGRRRPVRDRVRRYADVGRQQRSEEHTSELQSRQYLVCRLLLEKNKIIAKITLSGNP